MDNKKKNPNVKLNSKSNCLVSGLPISSWPEWTGIDLEEGYSVTFKLIGNNILLSIPSGNSGKNGMRYLFEKRDKFLKDTGLSEKKYVEIKDFSKITGRTSKEGRMQFTNSMIKEREKGNLSGFFGYNMSTFVKWSFNVGTKINRTTFPLTIVNSYEEAVKSAVKILNGKKKALSGEKHKRFTKDEWFLKFDDYSVRFIIIDNDIILTEATGKLKKIHIDHFFKLYRKILSELELPSGYYYRIADWRNLKGTTWGARRLYIKGLETVSLNFHCAISIGFGLNKFMRSILNVSRSLLSYSILVVENIEAALKIIEQEKSIKEIEKKEVSKKTKLSSKERESSTYINKLLRFMGNVNWDIEGVDDSEKMIPESHPFKPLFEAVSLIKQDFDEILVKMNSAEKIAIEQNKYNRLRADIWKIASEKSLEEHVLIQKLLDKVGPAIGFSRACYNRILGNYPDKYSLECVIEWCANDVKPSLGVTLPGKLIKQFIHMEPNPITIKTALQIIPKPLRLILKPILTKLEKSLNIDSVLMIPHEIDNKVEGFLTFDVCIDNKAKPVWKNDIRVIILETVTIASNYISQKRLDEALKESQEYYQTLAETSIAGICISDLNENVNFSNPAFSKIIGYSQEELMGKNHSEFSDKKEFEKLKERTRLRKKGSTSTYETTLICRNGDLKNILVSASPLKNKDSSIIGTMAVVIDITERKKYEQEKEKLNEQLIQAQKMEAIGTLAGGIAHDFNNILGVIMGYTCLTLDDSSNPKVVKHNLSKVIRASERAKDMVTQILTFSRKSNISMGPVSVAKVLNETISFLRSTIPTTIEIKYSISPGLDLIFGNTTQINQILMNLCTNAGYAMRENGGILEINLKQLKVDTDYPIPGIKPGNYQYMIVRDNGCGMSKEIMERIFDPYYTTKKEGEGTGMGLSTTYGIMKNHGGHIKVHSELEKGTIFHLYFPILEMGKELEIDDKSVIDLKGNNERILLVDDEQSLVEVGSEMLEQLDYRVEKRINSLGALAAFKSNPGKYDLIITDMTMPNMTGIKLASEIHKIRPEIPIILCTGFSTGVNKDNFKLQGVDGLIMKPVVKGELSKIIREVLDKKHKTI